MRFKKFILFISLIVISSSCSTVIPSGTTTPTSTNQIATAYPPYIPPTELPTKNGYPAPIEILPTSMTGTMDPQKGEVVGVLQLKGAPVASTNLYLADIIPNPQATEVAVHMERGKSPSALTDQNGNFNFVNIPPGRYALMFDAPPNAYLLLDLKTHLAITVSVTAGAKADLGTLNYDDLPK